MLAKLCENFPNDSEHSLESARIGKTFQDKPSGP